MAFAVLCPSHGFLAKSTIHRFNATPDERIVREEKLASAVRTILECIGEDPDREGLLRTPERYAKALMWLTRGYEERLTGGCILCRRLHFKYSLGIQIS